MHRPWSRPTDAYKLETELGFKRGLAWTGLGQGLFFVTQFAGSVVLARLLTPFEVGVYVLAAAVAGILALVQSIGLRTYIIREAEMTPERIATVFSMNVIISVLLALAIFLAALAAPLFASHAGIRHVLLILAVTPLFGILEFLPSAQLERGGEFKTLSIINICRGLLATVVTVALAFQGYSYLSFAWGQVAAAVAGTILVNIAGASHASFRVSLANWRNVGRFGMHMLAISGVNSLAVRASDLLMGKLTGLVALGLFSRASNVFNMLWENLHLVLGKVVLVEFSEQKRQGKSLRASYLRISEGITALLWPAFAGLAVLAEPLMHHVYGPRWAEAAVPFAILAVSGIVQLSITMTWELFVVSGQTARQARIETVRVVVGTILFAIGCTISLAAAAGARLLDSIFSMLIYRPHLERMTDTSLRDMLPIYARSGMLTALAVGPAAAAMWLSDTPTVLPLWQIAASVLLGAALWGVGLLTLKHPLYAEVRQLIQGRAVQV